MATCANCAAANPDGQKFCGSCGTALVAACPSCGAASPPGQRFCGECGTPLTAAAPAAPAPRPSSVEPAAAERRLVSVLFADLVGFTALSESRDPEDVRELLSRYFDTCRRLIELYGGTVEKFIGDAVMAVWGTPTATEDDAERAVRAALDLVAAVSALGQEVGAEELRARAGVLTGEAAVTIGATGQGMVAGDLVNTASRIQAAAEPGSVFVGEATRRATEQAIVHEAAGSFALKGKEGETPLWRALRVVSGVGGQLKSQGLEAPFVGRDRELRQIKDMFHVCADERRAQLVSVTGIAGIGKSRLVWEFYKYFDGITQIIYWHRGRCLAYGEGVTYWALADMVRMRCGIAEDDEAALAARKLQGALDEHLLDPAERAFVAPRLAQLLGLGETETRDRQDLFAAWRLFFERLSETYPVVLAFEDMQWADASLLDFVEYLLEWSRNHPIYVITLSRPELLERRPTWGAGHRNFASLYLEPLSAQAMVDLLGGLVPGLPDGLKSQILERAEGVPLYAVETVRMLLDRGLLVEEEAAYRVVGEVGELEVPETLHALIAARLDGLSADERRLLGDAAVLGKTFTPAALAVLAGVPEAELEPLLTMLVRREVLGLQSDPRSPEQGQYGFLQDLLRHVAYETLPRRERRAKHLAAAEHLSGSLAEDEVIEVVAAHLLDAYRLDEEAPDAPELRARAHAVVLRAAERAASLGASAEASRYYVQAADLTDDSAERGAALLEAGKTALSAARADEAAAAFDASLDAYAAIGDAHAIARVTSWRAVIDGLAGRLDLAIERSERAYAAIEHDEPDADTALILVRLGSGHVSMGNFEVGSAYVERALDIAESLRLPEVLARGWNTKAQLVTSRRPEEARGLFQLAAETGLEHDLNALATTALANLSDICLHRDRYAESLTHLERTIGIARRIGSRRQEWFCLSDMSYALMMLGRWPEALARRAELPDEPLGVQVDLTSPLTGVLEIHIQRGELDEARRLFGLYEWLTGSTDLQGQAAYNTASAALHLADGRYKEALAAAELSLAAREYSGITQQDVRKALRHALEAAFALGDYAKADELVSIVEQLPVGLKSPHVEAIARRFRARLKGDDPSAEADYVAAANQLRKLELPFELAVAELDLGEWLLTQGRSDDAEPYLTGAMETFERLGAAVLAERTAQALGRRRTAHAVA